MSDLRKKTKSSLDKLENYLDTTDLKGYDPYDALNSKILKVLSLRNKWLRIAFTQGLKKFPINLRSLLLIEKGYNPKGLGLFLSSYVKLYALYRTEKYLQKINYLTFLLEEVKCNGYSGHCWGYNFPWQNRFQLLPPYTPTIVNTSFISHGLLDAYELLGDIRYLEVAKSACDFILKDLKITCENSEELCLSYTPIDNGRVYNANLLGASLLARVYSSTHNENLLTPARKMVNYVIRAQNADGSWNYSANKAQNWIDIYHSGFVLESIYIYMKTTGDWKYLPNLEKGLRFFKKAFFLEDGRPKLWHNRKYPADIHSAQAIVTLTKLQPKEDKELLEKLVAWIINHLQDPSGYFYYQKRKFSTNKIPYMRWSQAWAFHALTTYYVCLKDNQFNKEENKYI